ncbi:hypothetical protein VTP01DRAFT_7756 [Rhizomucor pusillus]|uniref:uncharacterized protein n=1 Tax=Rhizomucor pusillus TaxID=4840 RepID=UPI003743B334
MVKSSILTFAVTWLLSSSVLASPTARPWDIGVAPLYEPADAETISDSYIVVLKRHVTSRQALTHCEWVGHLARKHGELVTDFLSSEAAAGIRYTYDTPSWRGYSGKFSQKALEDIRRSPEVAYVERDSVVYASELQRSAPWGLARISHREKLTLRTFNKYIYEPQAGQGIKVFVIDTGINIQHSDFDGRAQWGVTIPEQEEDIDGNGHGSHCAGTIAGRRFGVAKEAQPVAVKVLRSNGSGSMSGVLAGVNWALEQHQMDAEEARASNKTYKGAVANMSLGGGRSKALNMAVNEAVRNGIVFAVAAGNDNRDACQYSPAGAEKAITVGASNLADEKAYFSNHGKCLDVFAPGQDIMSIWKGSKTATNTLSGTSMASPHVAGLCAYLMSLSEEPMSPQAVKDKILALATKGALTNLPKDTPNMLIYNDAPKSFF